MKKHKVHKDETLSEIAKSYGVTVEAMLTANPQIIKRDKLYPGSKLDIPTPNMVQRVAAWLTK